MKINSSTQRYVDMQRLRGVESVEATTLRTTWQRIQTRRHETFHNYIWQMWYINKKMFWSGGRWTASISAIPTTTSFLDIPWHIYWQYKNSKSFLMILGRNFEILLGRKINERKQSSLHCEFTNIQSCEGVFIYEDQNYLVRLHSGNIRLLFVDRVAWWLFCLNRCFPTYYV